MEEIWKDIKGYEGLYQVSNLGNVRKFNKASNYDKRIKKYTYLKPQKTKDGYFQVTLYKNNTSYRYSLHRLIAQTFIPNPNNLPQINHIDENRTNNNIDNLEWCDSWYNCHYGNRIEKARKGHFKKIKQFDIKGNFIRQWCSIVDASKILNIDSSSISAVCKNKRKTAGGYIWKYERR